MDSIPVLQPYSPGAAGDVIKPFLSSDGLVFASDFWMVDRMGAQKGALVADYEMALVVLGSLGTLSARGAHNVVVGPDDPSVAWNGVMTSPGTIGWNPRGATYAYDPFLPAAANYSAWLQSGCPKRNAQGDWANNGLPLAYVQETWKGVTERNLDQPGFPRAGKRGRWR